MIPHRSSPRLHAGERRQQLLETALDFFARKGFKGTTTKEIAAAAGVTEAVVFRHFPSKQALYQAVLDNSHESAEMQEWITQAKSSMERGDDAGLFYGIALKILESYRRDARLQRVLLFAALEGHEHGLDHHRQLSVPLYELLCRYLEERQRKGELRDYDCGMILVAIAGMATHFATITQMFGFACDMPDPKVAEIFTSIMMNGIQPSKERARK